MSTVSNLKTIILTSSNIEQNRNCHNKQLRFFHLALNLDSTFRFVFHPSHE